MPSRKIPREYDNPIDNILVDLSEFLNPYFHRLNFTPNMITTLSLIFGLAFILCFHIDLYMLSALFLLISYFFDCMDGNYARTYNMQTKFGDMYDHIKDWTVIAIFVFLFIFKSTSIRFKLYCLLAFVLLMIPLTIHVGCTEEYIKSQNNNIENSATLNIMSHCPSMKLLNVTKYFGTGSLYILLVIILMLHYQYKKN